MIHTIDSIIEAAGARNPGVIIKWLPPMTSR